MQFLVPVGVFLFCFSPQFVKFVSLTLGKPALRKLHYVGGTSMEAMKALNYGGTSMEALKFCQGSFPNPVGSTCSCL